MATFSREVTIRGGAMVIRSAEPDDAASLIQMIRQMDAETTFLSREPGEFALTEEAEAAYIARAKASPDDLLLVATIDGSIVGRAGATRPKRLRNRHIGEVGVAVAASHWGCGVGRALMQATIDWLRAQGVEKAELTVDTANRRAVALYHSLGFVVEGTCRHERKLEGGEYRDGYWMGLFL